MHISYDIDINIPIFVLDISLNVYICIHPLSSPFPLRNNFNSENMLNKI